MPFKSLKSAYFSEAKMLSTIAESGAFHEFLEQFADYRMFLQGRPDRNEAYEKIERTTDGAWVLDAHSAHNEFIGALYTGHLAACCMLLKGSNFFPGQLRKGRLAPLLEEKLSRHEFAPSEVLKKLGTRFHTMDAVRTMQILRCLGLVTIATDQIEQLGLGAGGGDKDIWHLHFLPSISEAALNNVPSDSRDKSVLVFDVSVENIRDIVIIDADPQHGQQYRRWKELKAPRVIALNEYMDQALGKLPDILEESNMNPRNMVTAIRLDHRMFPDVDQFLTKLHTSISDEADLILSIGSGHTLEDFEGRVNKINAFFNELRRLGMKPVLIKLHGRGSIEQQRNSQVFGVSGITTYQILYCRLLKSALA